MITLTVPELQQLIINDDTGERFAPPSVMRSLVVHLELECPGRSIDLRADGSYFFVDTDHEVATVIPFDREAGGWPLERIPDVVAPGADADAFMVTVSGVSRFEFLMLMETRFDGEFRWAFAADGVPSGPELESDFAVTVWSIGRERFAELIDGRCGSQLRWAFADASEHQFIVTVTGCSREQAQQVMAERLNVDEDYGFDYTIGYTAGGMIATGAAS